VVTTTVMDILIAAYARSIKNRPGTIATEATELLELVRRIQRYWYSYAATINYTVFAGLAEVQMSAESGGPLTQGWERPDEAVTIFRVERTTRTEGGEGTDGTEVSIVAYDDRGAEQGKGAIFRLGLAFFPAGNPKDPTGGTLRFYFSRKPNDPATVDDLLDEQWRESYNDLFILDVAIYLAAKDGRADEVMQLNAERTEKVMAFTEFLKHPEANERRRFGTVRRVPGTQITPPQAG